MSSAPTTPRQTVLIVDDIPENLMVLGELLQPYYRVRVASSGAHALQVAASAPRPDLILLDVLMPEMDGYSVIVHLRNNPVTCNIPVIFVTAMDATEDEARGLQLGAVDYITKPIRPSIVLARVRAHLELKQTRDTLKDQNTHLNRANAELARALRIKDEFLATMSHELRTPLNAILGMSEALQEQVYGPLSPQQHKTISAIERSGEHLLSLINDILDLTRIESGSVELQIEPVSISAVCQESLQFVRQQAHKKHLNLSLRIGTALDLGPQDQAHTLPHTTLLGTIIYADQRRLKQILVNLLANGVKFTPEGGSVGLDVQIDEERHRVYFTIWDTGMGIAPEDQSRIFRPFIQVDSGLAREYEGTGLGLALVLHLTELHGGSVTLESEIGKGSRFTVALPQYRQTDSDSPEEAPDEGIKAKSPTEGRDQIGTTVVPSRQILLAEDNETNITTVSGYLEAQGYQIIVAHDGIEAIEAAQAHRPSLILMDIQMPRLNGLEAIRRIRADSHLAHIPIIALTALAMTGDRERCLEAGANEYLSKPVRLKELARLVAGYLASAT